MLSITIPKRSQATVNRTGMRITIISLTFLFIATAARGADTLYVARFGAGEVDKITSTGDVSVFATGLSYPLDLVADTAGNLYVSCNSERFGEATVQKITPDGTISTFATGLGSPTAIVFDRSGNLYATSEPKGIINQITPDGLVSVYATMSDEPEGLAFDSSGNLFVSTLYGGIYKITPEKVVSHFTGRFSRWGTGLVIDANNNLYMGDDAATVFKITPNGEASPFAWGTTQAMGLGMGSDGSLYVADIGSGSLKKVGPSGGAMSTVATGLVGIMGVVAVVPEPSTLALLGMGGIVLIGFILKRRN